MTRSFLNMPWAVWGGLALVVAAVFVVLVPSADKVNAANGFQFVVLRWFHSLCWVLIALNFFVRGFGGGRFNRMANLLAAAGGIAYAVYMIALVQMATR
jgi:hypothetical protein